MNNENRSNLGLVLCFPATLFIKGGRCAKIVKKIYLFQILRKVVIIMIDKLDQELILELHKEGRQSYINLAKSLHVSETTVRNRLRRLLDKGIITIATMPNLEALGYHFMGIVGMQVRLADLRTVADQLIRQPNVCYLANVTGRYDFIAIIVTRSSREFADFVENVISPIPSILRTETFVNLNIYKGQVIGLDAGHLISNLDISLSKKQ